MVNKKIPLSGNNYQKNTVQILQKELGIKNVSALPKVEKIVINIGLGRTLSDEKFLEVALRDMALITGQKLKTTLAKKSIANFKIREGMIIGAVATLRGKKMYDFISRLVNVALPRTRDFRGISLKSLDKRGNLTIGVKEHIVFPEIKSDEIKNIFGFGITITVKAKNKEEAAVLYKALAFPMQI
ncbi:MAG: 50S ribosomal protein L5 [Candidatus Azambacteria bacterium GW2011_GWE1_42_9]|nr:MAG: 50S ribosomal protein L5 [Candidatus Azambacteria bacterium GW2011_GWF1_41_10]KKS49518.1 MAG: 50S ribosomal protein L5 [Candidatus Azambacteria bacterium GW2011_GWF2_42_22]KKS69607.1 MAG: 50S ribosomal protein L5 [Candidatus Azambacteria bacterium GW2011_GWA2_42_62]KKS74161.1 MAG: 50S ribosomal protein L5 [Candidatus Azambacteria bacterium GW2011_GWB1_42_72]KKS79519.1 MAG: 50S ribosomal protein L5 [Candidatus Azambacteria bacterium GW2011_GWE1_42_9]KKT03629.1 MAG: 50S ribosomal protein